MKKLMKVLLLVVLFIGFNTSQAQTYYDFGLRAISTTSQTARQYVSWEVYDKNGHDVPYLDGYEAVVEITISAKGPNVSHGGRFWTSNGLILIGLVGKSTTLSSVFDDTAIGSIRGEAIKYCVSGDWVEVEVDLISTDVPNSSISAGILTYRWTE